jgi:propanol-preferring alcohol dehydrogenase
MKKQMRAVVAEGLGKPFALREVPMPDPGEGQALVRVMASGVCPTDTSLAHGSWLMKKPQFPYIPGHEGCGYVAALGPGASPIKEGDRVAIFWLNSACGSCEYCSCGRENLCVRQQSTGYTMNGTHAEYCLVSKDFLLPLPKGDFAELTPIMCAGVTSYKAVKQLAAPRGSSVVIMGAGGTGHLAIQYAKLAGLQVAVIDVDDGKLELARDLGATIALNAAKFPVNRINRETGGAHGLIVTAPDPRAFDQAMKMLRRGGTCVLVGVAEEALGISAFQMVINELVVRGSVSGTRQDLGEALQLAANGGVRVVMQAVPMDNVNSAIQDLREGKVRGRVVLTMN